MFLLTYVSSAVTEFSAEELRALLSQSVKKNVRLGVTGMLLYKDGNFMQAIEGEESAVRALYATIGKDPRHKGVIPLVQGLETKRHFPDWSMGYRDLHAADALATPGYSEFLNTPLTGAEFAGDPTRSQRLLLMFKKNM